MAGLVPAIQVFVWLCFKTWMAGTRPGMKAERPRLLPSLRRDGGFPRRARLGDLRELRLERAAQAAVDAVEIEIDHRRDVEREQLGEAQPAHHRDAQRLGRHGRRARG